MQPAEWLAPSADWLWFLLFPAGVAILVPIGLLIERWNRPLGERKRGR